MSSWNWLFSPSYNAIRFFWEEGIYIKRKYKLFTLGTVSYFSELNSHCFNVNIPTPPPLKCTVLRNWWKKRIDYYNHINLGRLALDRDYRKWTSNFKIRTPMPELAGLEPGNVRLITPGLDYHIANCHAPVDSAIRRINHYPLDNSIGFASVYPCLSAG